MIVINAWMSQEENEGVEEIGKTQRVVISWSTTTSSGTRLITSMENVSSYKTMMTLHNL